MADSRKEPQIPGARAQIDEGVSGRVMMYYADRVAVLQQEVDLLEKDIKDLTIQRDKVGVEATLARDKAVGEAEARKKVATAEATRLDTKRNNLLAAKDECGKAVERNVKLLKEISDKEESVKEAVARAEKKGAQADTRGASAREERSLARTELAEAKAAEERSNKSVASVKKAEEGLAKAEESLAGREVSYKKSLQVLKDLETSIKTERKATEATRDKASQEGDKAEKTRQEVVKATKQLQTFCALAGELKRFIIENSKEPEKVEKAIDAKFPTVAKEVKKES
jgi:chromosome segregation ATPase